MGLAVLILGLIVFLGAHTFVAARATRAAAIARLGAGPYRLLFSLVSVIGLVLIVWGYAHYRQTGWVDLWHPPAWTRHLTVLLTWPAIVFIVAAYVPGHIKRMLKHPMLAGVKLWAFAHLLSNGDLGSIVLFGSFLAWAVFDRIAVKRREAEGEPAKPVPVRGWTNDVLAVVIGSALYLALGFWFHPYALGVPVFGR
jgi:uncharacterized membrane protein